MGRIEILKNEFICGHVDGIFSGDKIRMALARKKAAGFNLGRPPTIASNIRQKVLEMKRAGKSYRLIAEATGISKTYAFKIAKTLGDE